MSEASRKAAVVLEAAEVPSRSFSHPWHKDSLIDGTMPGRLAGLERTGVSVARVAPGKESVALHAHHFEEEWVYILRGRAMLIEDGAMRELGLGDFVGFPTLSAAHNLRNPFGEDVVYLMGGENQRFDVVDFPQLDRVLIRKGDEVQYVEASALKPMSYSGSDPEASARATLIPA